MGLYIIKIKYPQWPISPWNPHMCKSLSESCSRRHHRKPLPANSIRTAMKVKWDFFPPLLSTVRLNAVENRIWLVFGWRYRQLCNAPSSDWLGWGIGTAFGPVSRHSIWWSSPIGWELSPAGSPLAASKWFLWETKRRSGGSEVLEVSWMGIWKTKQSRAVWGYFVK